MSRRRAANTRIRFVFTRVAQHLRRRAASTPDGTAQVFASLARLLGNLITGSNILTGAAQGVNGPKRKESIANESQNSHVSRRRVDIIRQGCQVQGRRVNEKSHNQETNHAKRSLRTNRRPRLSEPRQLHTRNHLGHGDLCAAQRAPQGRMTPASRAALAEARLPVARGRVQARSYVGVGKGSQKDLAFLDAAFGLM